MSNSPERILLIEDEVDLGNGLCFNLEAEGMSVEWQQDGAAGLEAIRKGVDDLSVVILDLMLPEMSGFEVLEATRKFAARLPVLVLSARSMESDKIRALELGADDFVAKPFSLGELLLRVKGLSKRRKWYREEPTDASFRFGSAEIDLNNLMVKTADGKSQRISPTEGLLIRAFHSEPDSLLTRASLLKKVWQYDGKMETRTVDVFVSKVRKLVEADPAKPRFLLSVRGVGYIYVPTGDKS